MLHFWLYRLYGKPNQRQWIEYVGMTFAVWRNQFRSCTRSCWTPSSKTIATSLDQCPSFRYSIKPLVYLRLTSTNNSVLIGSNGTKEHGHTNKTYTRPANGPTKNYITPRMAKNQSVRCLYGVVLPVWLITIIIVKTSDLVLDSPKRPDQPPLKTYTSQLGIKGIDTYK